jgi:hypothetical protein
MGSHFFLHELASRQERREFSGRNTTVGADGGLSEGESSPLVNRWGERNREALNRSLFVLRGQNLCLGSPLFVLRGQNLCFFVLLTAAVNNGSAVNRCRPRARTAIKLDLPAETSASTALASST